MVVGCSAVDLGLTSLFGTWSESVDGVGRVLLVRLTVLKVFFYRVLRLWSEK